MIKIEWKDKNGKELSNGDTIRIFAIVPEMQEEFGENIPRPGGYYQHQIGTECKWVEKVFDPQKQLDTCEYSFLDLPSGGGYDRDELCTLFDLPQSVDDEEFEECVLYCIRHEANIPDDTPLEGVLPVINGFEIVHNKKNEV